MRKVYYTTPDLLIFTEEKTRSCLFIQSQINLPLSHCISSFICKQIVGLIRGPVMLMAINLKYKTANYANL